MKIFTTVLKRAGWVALVGIVITLLGFGWLLYAPPFPEPRYQGKLLTAWAGEIDQSYFWGRNPRPSERDDRAIAAIRRIGTNALPPALMLCAAQDSWLKKQLENWVFQYNFRHWDDSWQLPIHIKSAEDKRYEGTNIIWALGDIAAPAIPELVKQVQHGGDAISDVMLPALPGAGTNAIPPLVELTRSHSPEVRLWAALVLGRYFGAQAHAAVPILIECLETPDLNQIRHIQIISTLGFIKTDADVIVPALERGLQSETNFLFARNYAISLEKLGSSVSPLPRPPGYQVNSTNPP